MRQTKISDFYKGTAKTAAKPPTKKKKVTISDYFKPTSAKKAGRGGGKQKKITDYYTAPKRPAVEGCCDICGALFAKQKRRKYFHCDFCDQNLCQGCFNEGSCTDRGDPKEGGAFTHGSWGGQQWLDKYKKPDGFKNLVMDTSAEAKAFDRWLMQEARFPDIQGSMAEHAKLVEKKSEKMRRTTEIALKNKVHLLKMPEGEQPYIIERPTIEKLEQGRYTSRNNENVEAKTEKNHAKTLKKWLREVPYLQKYRDEKDLTWLVKEPLWVLVSAIMRYYHDKGNQLNSIRTGLWSIRKPLELTVGSEHELSLQYAVFMLTIRDFTTVLDGQNKLLTQREKSSFVPYPDLLVILEGLERDWEESIKAYGADAENGRVHKSAAVMAHQNLIALALNVLDFPARTEKWKMSVVDAKEKPPLRGPNNLLVIPSAPSERLQIIFGYPVKNHEPITYRLNHDMDDDVVFKGNKKLNELLKRSLKVYPRRELFFNVQKWVKTKGAEAEKLRYSAKDEEDESSNPVGQRLAKIKLPEPYTGKTKLGANMIRSSFATYFRNKMNSNEQEVMFDRMRTSEGQIRSAYTKFFAKTDQLQPKLAARSTTADNVIQAAANRIERSREPTPQPEERRPISRTGLINSGDDEIEPAAPPSRQPTPAPPSRATTPAPPSRAATPAPPPSRPPVIMPQPKPRKDPRLVNKQAQEKWRSKPENREKHRQKNKERQTTDYAYALDHIRKAKAAGKDPSPKMVEKYRLKELADGTWVTEIEKPQQPRANARKQDRAPSPPPRAPSPPPSNQREGDDEVAAALRLLADRLSRR